MVKIVIKERDPKDPLNKLEGKELQIRNADERSLKVRWDSGTMLRELRDAKWEGVPGGIEGVAKRLDVSRPELQNRMRFAERREALVYAVNKGWSWHETLQHMSELVPSKRKATKKTTTTSKATTSPKTASVKDEAPKEQPAPKQEATPTEEAPNEQETPERPPKVVPANEVEIRRMKNTLHRTHGDGLTETALKLLDQMVEEIARILDEAGTAKRGAAQ
jgi:hypothetical protein